MGDQAMANDKHVRVVDTIEDLRGVTLADAAAVILVGHSTPGDGGGGVFAWDADIVTHPAASRSVQNWCESAPNFWRTETTA